jgi:hypothetical protein
MPLKKLVRVKEFPRYWEDKGGRIGNRVMFGSKTKKNANYIHN